MKDSYKLVVIVTILVLIIGFIYIQLDVAIKNTSHPDEVKQEFGERFCKFVVFCIVIDVVFVAFPMYLTSGKQ
jgi:uncharacterized membrane protein YkvI